MTESAYHVSHCALCGETFERTVDLSRGPVEIEMLCDECAAARDEAVRKEAGE